MITRFFRWWLGELSALLPNAGQGGSAKHLDTLVIRDEGPQLRVFRRRGTADTELGSVARGTQSDTTAIPGVARLKPGRTQVLIAVPAQSMLQKEVQLPRAAGENLREVLRYEMERLTPFRADEVLFDADVLDPTARTDLMKVRLRVLPRRVVDGTLELLRGWHFELSPEAARIRSRGDETFLAFVPSGLNTRRSGTFGVLIWVLNLVLLGIAIGLPLWEQSRQLEAVEARLAAVRGAAEQAVSLREARDAMRDELDFLNSIKLEAPPMVELLEEVSRLLPDTASLQRLEVRRRVLSVQGTAASASALISRLESSPLLSGVRFRSPVTRAQGEAGERFNITADVVDPIGDDGPRLSESPPATLSARLTAPEPATAPPPRAELTRRYGGRRTDEPGAGRADYNRSEPMSPAGSRMTALALLGLLLTLVYVYAVEPLWGRYQEGREAIESSQFRLERMERLAAQRVALQGQLEDLRSRWQSTPMTLPEASPSLAAATLQEKVKSLVSQYGGALMSTQALKPEERDRFAQVSVNARMTVTTAGMQRILHDLENEQPFLVVSEVTVVKPRPRRATARGRGRSAASEELDLLDVRIQVTGYVEPAGAAQNGRG